MKTRKRLSPFCVEFYANKINPETKKPYTDEEAIALIRSYRRNSPLFWIKKGFSEEEAIQKVKKFQTEQSQKSAIVKKNMVDGSTSQYMYWVNRKGYTVEEAKQKVSERQKTFSKEKCIEKYGEEEGLKRWQERQDKWQNTLNAKTAKEKRKINSLKSHNLRSYIRQYGFEEGLNLYCERRIERGAERYYINKTKALINSKNTKRFNQIYENFIRIKNKIKGRASRESLKTIMPLYKIFRKEFKVERRDLRIGVGGSKEYAISYTHKNKKTFFSYDFTCINLKIIVEHHNLCWHPSPYEMSEEEFNKWRCPGKKITGAEKYQKDQFKKKIAEENGFMVFEVWSHKDIGVQLEQIINEVRNRLKDNS